MNRGIPLVLVLGLLAGVPGLRAAEPPPAGGVPEDVTRLIVKLQPSLAASVEAELPLASLRLASENVRSAPVRGFLSRHGGQELRPVYSALVRAKKETGRSERDLAMAVRQKFAARSARRQSAIAAPTLANTYILQIPPTKAADVEKMLAALWADAGVVYAEVDQQAAASMVPDDPYFSSSGTWGQAYGDLYGIHRIHADTAWDTTTGSGVVVAVIDSGLDINHPDIAANVWTNTGEIPGNGIDDDGNGFVDDVHGWDFVGPSSQSPTPDNDPADKNGHGTHVAGTIAAVGNNGVGVIGVAPSAKIMPVRGLDDQGYGDVASLAAAIHYAAANGADVMNNSWDGFSPSQAITDAMAYAYDLGVVIVAATGNNGTDALSYSPANLPTVVTVGAVSPTDTRSRFGNGGTKIDVVAPGEDILSLRAAGTSLGTPVGADYTRADGGSTAAPHVSGVAALVLAQHPEYTNEQVRQVLRVSAVDVEDPGYDLKVGYGRVDAAAALAVTGPLESKIQSPFATNISISSPTTVLGLARGAGFASYVLEYGAGETPTSWTTLNSSTTPASGGALGTFDPSGLTQGFYTLRLTATNADGVHFVDRVRAYVTDITPPTIAITAPADGAALSGTVTITASASDDVKVYFVDFYLDGVHRSTLQGPPFTNVWNTAFASNGVHTLTAQASDVAAHRTMSAPVTVTVSNATAAVAITSPAAGTALGGIVSLKAQVGATGAYVQYYVDGVYLATGAYPPYTVPWDTRFATNGPHTIKAIAGDGYDQAQSAPVSVTTSNAPILAITAPTAGATVSGLVTVTATVTADPMISVSHINFFVDDVELNAAWDYPYTTQFDSTWLLNGSHTIRAQGIFDGARRADATITVTTSNVYPPYDPVLKVPVCRTNTGVCDSGPQLVAVGAGEPNQPNTIYGSCPDGPYDPNLASEANDRISVSTIDGQPFHPGVTVRVASTFFNLGGDFLDLYYAADATNPVWTFIATLTPTVGARRTLSTTYVLPSGPLQAVRARVRYRGDASSPCLSGTYVDHDDLAFAVSGANELAFYTVPPCRVLDTRNPAGPYGAPALAGGADRAYLPAGTCGIPPTARAISANVTITAPTLAGDLRLFPSGQAMPMTSVINFTPGRTRANNAIVKLGADGRFTVHDDQAAGARVDFILDVNGYFQ